jgi:Flp pilus assembly protein TadD
MPISQPVALYNRAVRLGAAGQHAAAMQLYAQAIELDPYNPEALNNLGILLHQQGNLDAARLCYARSLAAKPGYVDAEYNYATAESDCGNYQAALLHLSRLLERSPKRADAWNNLGNVFLALRQPAEALEAFQLALSLNPALPDLCWNMSLAELLLGRMPEAWQHFEGRSQSRHAAIPQWRGEPLEGKRLLVHAEQGIGDTIQFARYCSHVVPAYTVLECHSELIELFRCLSGPSELMPFCAPVPSVDYQIPLMSLPWVFQTGLETIPNFVPYLNADHALQQQWKERLNTPVRSRKVGLVWSGNPKHRNDRNRSIDPAVFGRLSEIPDTAFYCLQQKPLSANAFKAHPLRFTQILDELTWPDTAAVIANMDLVISVDTAVAHLAGALACPVWTLLPYAPDWRWMLDRTDSPWYPTMRLFRQSRLGDWTNVLDEIARELTPALL